ncbi:VOC family protein [Tropicibacter oceani]|uniref:VOC family protein n=1 Tax=Tropicibacter oceani TaxID=3058420 RepID=A0ABY8QMF7_9RHOB|nr:VOC family protein [Tropicibacter oceani]WGW05754.1 VOC family protein [Tropicibacter oceani]
MDQRISLITLGVRDLEKAAGFYEALGWTRVEAQDGVIAFDLIGQTLGLYPIEMLARDMGVAVDRLGAGASTLGHNLASREAVDALAARAEAAGATVLRPPHEVFWGGYIAYVADPEGHVWEFAHNPFSPLGPKGEFRWNGYG